MKKLIRIMTVALVITLGVAIYFFYLLYSVANESYTPPKEPKSDKRARQINIEEDPFSLLLVGVDARATDQGRADTIIVLTANPHKNSVKLTNIPRDTLVKIPGRDQMDKINHSYAYGGIQLTRETVEEFLDLPIDGYVQVNMEGLEKIVDSLGGIDIHVDTPFTFQGVTFQGDMTLNGKQTLAFVQMRKHDPEGDLGRNKRQQKVIRALFRKGTEFRTLTRLKGVLEQIGPHLKTDISPWKVISLHQRYRGIDDSRITTHSFEGQPTMQNGTYYWLIKQNEVKRVRKILAEHLELEP
jgi:LCP family protein required for cell wall assembly